MAIRFAVLRLTTLLCLLAPAFTGPAQAQLTDAQKGALKSNCRSDYMSNCMSVTPGGKEALMCLNSHMATLSPACQAAVQSALPPPPAAAAPPPAALPPPKAAAAPPAPPPAAAAAPTQPAAPPPAAAIAPPPPAAAPAPPKAKTKSNAKATAPKPAPPPPQQAAVPPPPAAPVVTSALVAKIEALPLRKRAALARACDRDRDANCKLVKLGTSMIVCLVEHTPALSPHCKDALTATLN